MELTDQTERKKKKKNQVCNTRRFRLVLSMEMLMEAGSVSFQRPVLKVSSATGFTLFHSQSPFSKVFCLIYLFIFLVAKLDSRQQRSRMQGC